MKLLHSFFFSLFCVLYSYGQTNTPPGSIILPKTDTEVDYSYKLLEMNVVNSVSAILEQPIAQPIIDITAEEFALMQIEQPEHYVYYTEALNYYNSLSINIKRTFTTYELWYVYFFDQELKNNLLNY